jgi:hypothetical protein
LFGSEWFVKFSFVIFFNPILGVYSVFTEMVEYVGVWDGLSAHKVESFDSTVLHRPARLIDSLSVLFGLKFCLPRQPFLVRVTAPF